MADLRVPILKHVANEGAGTILDFLRRRRIPFQEINLYDGAEPPGDFDAMRAVVIMGGPMNVYEEEKFPFLRQEHAFIEGLLKRRIPVLGVCLGSQLIAKAAGARVLKAPAEEIGWGTVTLTAGGLRDPLFSGMGGKTLKVLQWHSDTFELPPGAVHLAENPAVKHQAFRLGDTAYGLQFHVEITRAMLADWFKKRPDLDVILREGDDYSVELGRLTNEFYQKFFDLKPAAGALP